jgi:tRNA threonylcarbamoyladenosine biosynthesis protein TsaE
MDNEDGTFIAKHPDDTFAFGSRIGETLLGGEVILLHGGLGAGKTLLTKGILYALEFDTDDVTSPSFALVNHYRTDKFSVYHIDLWRLEPGADVAFGVGLDDILADESAVIIIEWAERLGEYRFRRRVKHITIVGDGDEPRQIGTEEVSAEAQFG